MPENTLEGTVEIIFKFQAAMSAVFGGIDFTPIADGVVHRFHVPGDAKGSQNGWYVLFAGPITAGVFGSWKLGQTHHWNNRNKPFNADEIRLAQQQAAIAKQQREKEKACQQERAADEALTLWASASQASVHHPYLHAKQVLPHQLRQSGNELLVPIFHDDELVNLQRISLLGSKRFLRGGRITGCYSPLGSFDGTDLVYVCEGWATGATIHESSGHPVACALNAGNLKQAALAIRGRYPAAEIIIAGDDDRRTIGNPGRSAAIAAALAVDGKVAFPVWPNGAPAHLTDFNDLARWSFVHEQ
ncbi:DNA primase TraC [compost metagenome]